MTLDEILRALPGLSQDQLTIIRSTCDLLHDGKGEEVDTTSPLYDAMAKMLGVKLSFRDFHNVSSYRTWRKNAPGVVSFIEETYPGIKDVAKLAVMTMLLEALIDDLKERGVPITMGTVANNINRLPQVFDSCFPDYRQNGMQYMVLKQMGVKL